MVQIEIKDVNVKVDDPFDRFTILLKNIDTIEGLLLRYGIMSFTKKP
jgi:hypothetical protein